MTSDETDPLTSAIGELKNLERERGELLKQPRTERRDERLDLLGRSQRRIVHLMTKARRKREGDRENLDGQPDRPT